ncbi:MAG: hypothetical protein DME49_01415 [Verrucomicrobia bacterium]|nr:MAG: hypothetical protein DME49_01415 [Verrucomicrobiota bacterium]
MREKFLAGVLCGFAVLTQSRAQEVEVPRESSAKVAASTTLPEQPKTQTRVEQTNISQPPDLTAEQMRKAGSLAAERVKRESQPERTSTPETPKPQTTKPEIVRPIDRPAREKEPIAAEQMAFHGDTAFTKLADGFDFPVGKPDAQGYYKARGFQSQGHPGEDWDGSGGGNTDLGDPIYSISNGVVVFARDCHMGWGNVVIVRHAYREGGSIKNIDSLYGHLDRIVVHRGQRVARGEQVGTMGTAHGLYDAHLHLEIRKNIEIGMSRAAFACDSSNYYDPSQFILSHRHLQTGWGKYRIAMNTFTHDALIDWDKARNYSHDSGGTNESAAALKKAVASQH